MGLSWRLNNNIDSECVSAYKAKNSTLKALEALLTELENKHVQSMFTLTLINNRRNCVARDN